MTSHAPTRRAIWAAAASVWLVPSAGDANTSAVSAADACGEPAPDGALEHVHLVHEDLRFDFRPAAAGGRPLVEARYRLRNDGAAVAAPLVFASPGIREQSVSLDGRSLPSRFLEECELADELHPRILVPTIGGEEHRLTWTRWDRRSDRTGADAVGFSVLLEPGDHELVVRYDVYAERYPGNRAERQHGIGYLLAPARRWASFGTLDVSVRVPTGWEFAATLPFERHGDVLFGTFVGLPADALGLATVPPVEIWMHLVAALPFIPVALAIGWCALAGWRAARRRGRCKGATGLRLVLMLLVPWTLLVLLATLAAPFGIPVRPTTGVWVANRIVAAEVVLALTPAVSLAGAICGLVAGMVAVRWTARSRTPGAQAAPRDDSDGTRAGAGS